MPYSIRKSGRNYDVIRADTGEHVATHKPPDAKKKAEAQIRLLEEKEHGKDSPDKVSHLSNGTKVNIHYKNKEAYSGAFS